MKQEEDMAKSKKKYEGRDYAQEDADAMGDSVLDHGDDIQKYVEKVSQQASDMHRVEILVAVNGHVAHDTVTVAKDHPFYSGLILQNLAKVVG